MAEVAIPLLLSEAICTRMLTAVYHLNKVAKEASKDPSMVNDGIGRPRKSRYDSISTYLHYCKRRAENPMHVLEVGKGFYYKYYFSLGRGQGKGLNVVRYTGVFCLEARFFFAWFVVWCLSYSLYRCVGVCLSVIYYAIILSGASVHANGETYTVIQLTLDQSTVGKPFYSCERVWQTR